MWDPETQSWKYTFGRNSIANKDEWLIEHKEGGDHDKFEDPFLEKKSMKKERIEKNEQRRLANKRRANLDQNSEMMGGRNAASLVVGSAAPTSGPVSQERLARALQVAQRSTRSVGVYDTKRDDEPRNKMARKVLPKDSASEKEQTTKILKKVTRLHESKEYDGDKMAHQQLQEERVHARKKRDAKMEAIETEKRRKKMK